LQKVKTTIVEGALEGRAVEGGVDESSQASTTERRVSVIERETGKVLSGDEAPTQVELQAWLQAHPRWEVHEAESGEESEEGESDEEGQSQQGQWIELIESTIVCLDYAPRRNISLYE
jgi:hypothetical protein